MAEHTIKVTVLGDASSLEKEFAKSTKAAGQFEKGIDRAGKGAIAASLNFKGLGRSVAFASAEFVGAAGFIEVAKKSVEQASALEDQMARTTAVFKDSASEIKSWSKDSAEALGLSQSAALDAANTIGTLLINSGEAPKKAAAMSKSMVQLAADMAAFKKVSPETALSALEAGLQGRTRSLKQFGITIDAASLKEEAYRSGIARTQVSTEKVQAAETKLNIARADLAHQESKYASNSTQVASARLKVASAETAVQKAQSGSASQLTGQQKALAAYNLILQQTRNEQGKFKTSGDELNVIEQKLHAQLQDVEAELGEALLPVMEKYGAELDKWIEKEQKSGALQRDITKAVHDLSAAVSTGVDVVKVATDAFNGLSDAVGGDKHAIELLIGTWLTYKAVVKGIALQSTITSLARIGTTAETASGAGGVGALRVALLSLGAPEVIGALAGVLGVLNLINDAQATTKLGTVSGVAGGYGNVTEKNGKYYLSTPGARGRGGPGGTIEISKARADALLGIYGNTQAGTDPTGKYTAAQTKAAAGVGSNYTVSKGVDIADENPMIPLALKNLAAAGYKVDVTSGYRTEAQQAALYARYVKSGFNIKYIAAKPGTSNHESGNAVDVYVNGKPVDQSPGALAILKKYGLVADVKGDHEHLDLKSADTTTTTDANGNLVVGTTPKKPKKPAVIRGSALLPAALVNATSIYSGKASNAATPNDVAYWLGLEQQDLQKAEKDLRAKLDQGSAKQKAATRAELTAIEKQLDGVNADMAKAKKAIADQEFAAKVKSSTTSFLNSLKPLDAKYAQLMLQSKYDTGQALEDDFNAVAGTLQSQKESLQGEVAKLTAELAGKDKTERTALAQQIARVQSALSKVNGEITTNLDNQEQALESALSTIQSTVSSRWSTYGSEIQQAFASSLDKSIAAIANNPAFFQNGALTPSEALYQQMTQQDQVDSLNKAIDDAIAQKAADVTAGADAATLAADDVAEAAAERQKTEADVLADATKERADVEAAYNAAVQKATDDQAEREAELAKVLDQFGSALGSGSVSIGDLQAWLTGANPEGWDFGLNLATINDASALTQSDFTDLSNSSAALVQAFDALIEWINNSTGASVAIPGVSTPSATLGNIPAGATVGQAADASSSFSQFSSWAVAHHIPGFAKGAIATRPTVAVIGDGAEPEGVFPISDLDRFLSGGNGGPAIHVHIEKVYSLSRSHGDARELAKAIEPHLKQIVSYQK